jgi:membrane protease YdiL (CAAX protease family)
LTSGPAEPPSTEEQAANQPPGGPPGASVFSLDRPAGGLYLLAWLLCGSSAALVAGGILLVSPALLLFGVLAACLGLPAAASYQILARSGRPAPAYRGPSPLILFLLVVVVVNVFGVVVATLTGSNGLDVDRAGVFLVGLLVQVAGYVGALWLFVVKARALSWTDMLGQSGRTLAGFAADVGTAIGVMLPVTIVALIIGNLVALILDASAPQVVPLPQSPLDAAVDALAAIVLAPLGEELFFRGFALTAWLRDLGPRSALIRSSLFFALVHILNVQVSGGDLGAGLRSAIVLLVVIVPIAFALGLLYLNRGLTASVTAHLTYNGLIFGLILIGTLMPLPPG